MLAPDWRPGQGLASLGYSFWLAKRRRRALVESVLDLEKDLTGIDADEGQDAQDNRDHDCGHHRIFSDVLAGVVRDCLVQNAAHARMAICQSRQEKAYVVFAR